jgi:heptose I phosphotransferase
MKGVKIFDHNLFNFFNDDEPFLLAENLEGEIYREYGKRTTKNFQFAQKSYFLKFHGPIGWFEIFKNLFQFKVPVVGALREFEALSHLKKHKIDSLEVQGFGNKGLNPANSSSFLITEELYGTISLEDFFLQDRHKELFPTQRRKLIKHVAKLIRKMHLSGLNHRDLYLCHLHIKKDIDFNDIKVYLIDLHRAQIRSNVPERWLVKDLGGFFHSILQFGLSERDFYRFMTTYFECSLSELLQNRSKLIKKILNRCFSMYMKPRLKEFSFNSREIPKESPYIKTVNKTCRWIANKDYDLEKFIRIINDESLLLKNGELIKNEEGHLIVKLKINDRYFYIKKYRIKSFFHAFSRLLKETRAFNSWSALHWINMIGINTPKPILCYESNGVLGARTSFLITEEINGERLDRAIENNINQDLVVAKIQSFFKRMQWIRFSHGDTKTSNFFISQKKLTVFDLDSAKRNFLSFYFRKGILRDKMRFLRSIENFDTLHSKLYSRLLKN